MTPSSPPSEIASEARVEKLEFQLLRLDAQIKMESDLINYRLQWLLASQTIAFAAYFAAGTGPVLAFVKGFVVAFGIVTSLAILVAIFAAYRSVKIRAAVRASIAEEMRGRGYRWISVISNDDIINRLGATPPFLMPIATLSAWIVILFMSF